MSALTKWGYALSALPSPENYAPLKPVEGSPPWTLCSEWQHRPLSGANWFL